MHNATVGSHIRRNTPVQYFLPIALLGLLGLNACQTSKPLAEVKAQELETRKPFTGQAQTIPGILEAETFDEGADGVTFHKKTSLPGNNSRNAGVTTYADATGQLAIAELEAGDWFEYSLEVAHAGVYDLNYRVKAPTKSIVKLSLDGTPIGSATNTDIDGAFVIPYLGSTNWLEVKQNAVILPAGKHVLRLSFDVALFALDSLEFQEIGTPTVNSIELNPAGPIPLLVNQKILIEAFLTGSGEFDRSLTWTSNPNTATLRPQDGKLEFSSAVAGDFTLTAQTNAQGSDPAKTDTVQIKVTLPTSNSPFEVGKWSSVINWDHAAIHAVLMPNGKVLMWGASGDNISNIPSFLWDPNSKQSSKIQTPANLFCAGHSLLPDGRLLAVGGNIEPPKGITDTTLFDANTSSWTSGPKMRKGRWYPSSLVLGSGEVLLANGYDESGIDNPIPELWQTNPNGPSGAGSSSAGTIHALTGASHRSWFYPMLAQAPDGRVLKAGPEAEMAYLNTSGNGGWTEVNNNNRIQRSYGNSVVFKPGKILQIGGSDGTSAPTNDASIVDLASANISKSGPMGIGRRQHNSTLLANGEIIITGGTSGGKFNDVPNSVLFPEIWNETRGTFKKLAAMQISRVYHSVALLLPDATILSAGGGGACEPATIVRCAHTDAEIFSPPYLFEPDGTPATRPTITSAPTGIAYAQDINIATDSTDIARVTLVKLSSVTHSQNFDQRFLDLSESLRKTGNNLTVTAPSSNISAPPGYYLLFVLNASGVPSIGKILKLN
jgi:Domain of unknown function (DUF1929)/Carbohydrate binding module (family 6)